MNLEKREKLVSKKYEVASCIDGKIIFVEKSKKPPLGGYISMKKYGNPDYCPSATRHHKKAKKEQVK